MNKVRTTSSKGVSPRKHLNGVTGHQQCLYPYNTFTGVDSGSILKLRTTKQGETMNFLDVLNTATAELSDNKLSKKLGINRTTVSNWRNLGTIPQDETLEKLAELTGIPVEKVFYAAYAEKVHNPIVAQLLRENSNLAA